MGDLKAPFSIATSLRCRGGCYSFPLIAPIPFFFFSPWYDLRLNPSLQHHWRTLHSLDQWVVPMCIYLSSDNFLIIETLM